MMRKEFFSLPDGTGTELFRLENGRGMAAEITDFGGAVVRLEVPDRQGRPCDVALGFRDPADYRVNSCYFGTLVGRYANRIRGGEFPWEGGRCVLPRNDHGNTLHGGDSFAQRRWQARPLSESELELTLISPDGDAGFPGELTVVVCYRLTPENELVIDYRATTTAATPVNLTNHLYFNLSGAESGTIRNQWIQLNAGAITETDDQLIPTGRILPVAGTPYDLRTPRRFDELLAALPGGYDDNFIFDGHAPQAAAWSPDTGIRLELSTTEPAVQLYTGSSLDGSAIGKGAIAYGRFAGFCLEAQHYADSPNHPEFPSTRLEPGQAYRQHTIYRFELAEEL